MKAVKFLIAAAMLAAGTAQAALPTVNLFGTNYDVSELTLTGATFGANTVAGTPTGVGLDFVEGATAAEDRLYCTYLRPSGAGAGLFYLTGADASGVFSTSSALSWLFGPSNDATVDGRPAAIYVRSLTDTGTTDKNFYMSNFQGNDNVNVYDATNFPTQYDDPTKRLGFYQYGPGGVLTGGTAALEEFAGIRAISVGARSGVKPSVCTFDMDAVTMENNAVSVDSPTAANNDQFRDVARLADGSYIGPTAPVATPGTRTLLLKFTVTGDAATPPVLTATLVAERNFTTDAIPGFNMGTEYLFGAAAGRVINGSNVLYLTGTDGTNAILYTLTPQAPPAAVKNWHME